jgi:hypothetical protein
MTSDTPVKIDRSPEIIIITQSFRFPHNLQDAGASVVAMMHVIESFLFGLFKSQCKRHFNILLVC